MKSEGSLDISFNASETSNPFLWVLVNKDFIWKINWDCPSSEYVHIDPAWGWKKLKLFIQRISILWWKNTVNKNETKMYFLDENQHQHIRGDSW